MRFVILLAGLLISGAVTKINENASSVLTDEGKTILVWVLIVVAGMDAVDWYLSLVRGDKHKT